jgi:hypothetical protein
MLGDTISLTLDGAAVVVSKINQDQFTSEYLKRRTTDLIRLRIRHSKENPGNGKPVYDRHNVELTQEVFPVGETPGYTRQAYLVIRNTPVDLDDDVGDLVACLSGFATKANTVKWVGWES